MARQTIVRRIAGRDIEVTVCQIKGGYGCKHKTCNGTAKTRAATGGTLRKGDKMFKCQDCGKLTHDSTFTGLGTMCRDCYDDAGMENEHSDGHHAEQANPDCKRCVEEYASSLTLVPSDEAMQALADATVVEHTTYEFIDDVAAMWTCTCGAHGNFPRSEYPLARTAANAAAKDHALNR